MVEQVIFDGQLYAIIVRSSFRKEGIEFFTESHFSQQLGYMNRPKGYRIQPHKHTHHLKEVIETQEVLFIRSGKLRVDFYRDDHALLGERILETGDVILLAKGGHGFEMLDQTEIIEVKQGPYDGSVDKVRF